MTKREIIERIRGVLRLHPEVVSAELYGSVARGEERPGGDVDLIVELDPASMPEGFAALRVFDDLEQAVGKPVSIAERRALDQSPDPAVAKLLAKIQPDRELIYERA
jgi:uncharacterized protein